ncbi:MAG: FAD-binding oxidoreductase [Candidatus Saliniplasma sp.]
MAETDYGEVDQNIIEKLKEFVGDDYVITDKKSMGGYKRDESFETSVKDRYPDVLVKPSTTDEISKIMKLANKNKIPVTPVGGKTGLVGGIIPVMGGISLSLERKDKKIDVDQDNLMVEVDAGITMTELYEKIEQNGLALPIHPTTGDAGVGGTISNNAAGETSLKHGMMRNYVMGLEVVLPNGEVIELGGKILKDNTGYSLKNLFIGAEGTLGIITKAVLRLYPPSAKPKFIVVPFKNKKDAIQTVPKIVKSGILPEGVEYLERGPIEDSERDSSVKWPVEKGEATLMIAISGRDEEDVLGKAEMIIDVCEENNAIDLFLATEDREIEKLLEIRERIGEGGGEHEGKRYWSADLCVPLSELPGFLRKTEEILEESSLDAEYYTFGHAGDGNVHVGGLFPEDMDKGEFHRVLDQWLDETIRLGGSVSGEHGVGIIRKSMMRKQRSKEELRLMEAIKRAFDPNLIMNPGKIVPEMEELEKEYVIL